MRYDPSERVSVYAMALGGLIQLEPDPEKRLKYATMRLFQLEQKFGAVPDGVRQRARKADLDTPEAWGLTEAWGQA